MGKTRGVKDRSSEQIGFRVTPMEDAAIRELVRRRHDRTGDASQTGWFREVIRRAAKEEGLTLEELAALAPPEAPEPAKAAPKVTRPRTSKVGSR